jgi:hypothetical protein
MSATPNGTRRRRCLAYGALSAAALVVPVLTVVGPAQALDDAGVGPRDPLQRGFPAYYSDDAGVALQMCDDGSANCLLARPRDLAPPEGEALYWAAFADLSSPGIDVSVEFALEAAWLDGTPVVFDRLRIRGHVNAPGSYTLTHPYGTTTVTAEDPGEQRNVNFTEDLGCEPVAGGRCRFRDATAGHITTWLRQTDAPQGYLGNPDRPSAVTGGLRQSVTLLGPAGLASTNQFGVLGKPAKARAVSVIRSVDFGNTAHERTRSVRMLNIGTQPLRLRAIRLQAERTLRRVPTPRTCGRGDVLQVGRSCTVGVRYRPDGRRRSGGRLHITDGAGKARVVRIQAMTAAVVRVRERVGFQVRRANTSSGTRRIVVTNTGSIPMRVRAVAVTGRNPGSFDLRSGAPKVCARGVSVRPGKECAVYVGFEPSGFGPKRARLVLRTNAVGGARSIVLSGDAR